MSKQQLADIIFFIDEQKGITRELAFGEFEAMLDGLVDVQAFANSEQRAVYAQVNANLRVVSCVLFRIAFDEKGLPSRDWNLPFDQLIVSAGKGPDLGAGPIKLSTSTQCSVPWHQIKLWDAAEIKSVFSWVVEAVSANRLGLVFDQVDETSEGLLDTDDLIDDFDFTNDSIIETEDSPFFSSAQSAQNGSVQAPMHGYPPHMMPPMPYGYDPSQPMVPPPGYYPQMLPQQHMHDLSLAEARLQQMQKKFRQKELALTEKLKQLQQRHKQGIQQQQEQFASELTALTRQHEQAVEEVASERNRWRANAEKLLTQRDSLEEMCAAQKAQVAKLIERLELLRQSAEKRERENVEALSRKYEQSHEQKMRTLTQTMEARLKEKDAEIECRQEVVKQLRKDITLLRRDKIRLVNSGADKFLERLEELGISFIAFHAGAGHISIPLRDMTSYIENPIAYAANRCLVSEELYRAWLSHYEDPVCRFVLNEKGHEICGHKVRKADVPSDFQLGVTDRCDKHRSLVAGWNNVVNIGG